MSQEKKSYNAPNLTTWGTIADLTRVGLTHPGTDMHSGSVNPPGHNNGNGPGKGKGRP